MARPTGGGQRDEYSGVYRTAFESAEGWHAWSQAHVTKGSALCHFCEIPFVASRNPDRQYHPECERGVAAYKSMGFKTCRCAER